MDSSLFSHPIAEQPRPGTLTTPQDSRYGSLFRQPVYTPAPASGDETERLPQRRSAAPGKRAYDPSGRARR
ncbi:hypothetical protein M8542_03000 [Amycolatopsis sp. OK19-0408]|uniref:Uncharacterized protein n=1 Tax=Amycolatopsis iheyensis TaxID=2945988 RepID=A0A9X2SGI2_9PSEU|nr:hypothetical protein [Amycolatopsis iheyensis]MCR6481777.1 hypothetical protein [Amycolatopsis iheyensis]